MRTTVDISADESKIYNGDPVTDSSSDSSSSGNPPLDDDLRHLIAAWPTLPDPVRAGIVAMVEPAAGER